MPFEAVVVGAGPAGTSAAIGLLRKGWVVTVFDQRSAWTGRVCGGFLNPEAVQHLKWMGLYEEAVRRGASPVTRCAVTTSFEKSAAVETIQKGTSGLAFPRQALEELLIEGAAELGARVRLGSRVTNVQTNQEGWTVAFRTADPDQKNFLPSDTGLQRTPADLVVLADGRFSLGAAVEKQPGHGWYGWNATFENTNLKPGAMSLHFFPNGYVGLLTFADGQTNVCGLVSRAGDQHTSWENVFNHAMEVEPGLKKILRDARRKTDWKGVGPLPFSRTMRPSRGPLLAGDAAAVGDPFMGEGIGRALGAGPMIHHCLSMFPQGKFDSQTLDRAYRTAWLKTYSSRLRMGRWSRRVLNSERMFRPLLRLLMRQEWILRRMTPRFHVGFSSGAASHKSVKI